MDLEGRWRRGSGREEGFVGRETGRARGWVDPVDSSLTGGPGWDLWWVWGVDLSATSSIQESSIPSNRKALNNLCFFRLLLLSK